MVEVDEGWTYSATVEVAAAEWHHLLVVGEPGQMMPALYVDGVRAVRVGDVAWFDHALSRESIERLHQMWLRHG